MQYLKLQENNNRLGEMENADESYIYNDIYKWQSRETY